MYPKYSKIIFTFLSTMNFIAVNNCREIYCMKSVHIRSYSGPHFPAYGLNTDQNNFEYGHFLCSDPLYELYIVELRLVCYLIFLSRSKMSFIAESFEF